VHQSFIDIDLGMFDCVSTRFWFMRVSSIAFAFCKIWRRKDITNCCHVIL